MRVSLSLIASQPRCATHSFRPRFSDRPHCGAGRKAPWNPRLGARFEAVLCCVRTCQVGERRCERTERRERTDGAGRGRAAPGLPPGADARTAKPPLHGQHWVAITGKPLAATAGAMIFQKGGNAVDAACAMLAAAATMWDTLSWGGETQALIFNPEHRQGHRDQRARRRADRRDAGVLPRARHEQSAGVSVRSRPITPGTPGGILTMLAEFGTMSLAEVLAPAIALAAGYPIEKRRPRTTSRKTRSGSRNGRTRAQLFLVHPGPEARGAAAGRDVQPAGSRRDAAQARRGRARRRSPPARIARPRSTPRTTASTKATSRASSCAVGAGAGGLDHDGGSRALAGVRRGAGAYATTKASTSTSSTPGCRAR